MTAAGAAVDHSDQPQSKSSNPGSQIDQHQHHEEKSMLNIFHEFAHETTLHGVHEISKYWSIWPLRLFFIFCQVACWSVMCFHMYLVISAFMAEPTIVQTVTNTYQSYKYPTLTFCPQLWLNVSRYHEMGISKPAFLYAVSLMKRVTTDPFNLTQGKAELKEFMDQRNISSFYDLYFMMANDYSNESLVCSQCATWPPKKVITEEGVCYHFTFTDWTPQYLVDAQPSIAYNPVKYPNDSIYESFQTLDFSEYIAIGMNENDFLALDPVYVLVNHTYFFRVTPTKHTLLNDDASPCVENPENLSAIMCKAYCGQQVRDRACHLKTVLGYFNESKLVGPHWNGTALLETVTDDDVLNYYKNVKECNKKVQEEINKCETEMCPPWCDELTFTTTVQTLQTRRIFEDLPDSALGIVLIYEVRAGVVEILEQYSYTWYSFLSDVGGLIGLWCGASVVSVIPLLTFFFHNLVYLSHVKISNRRMQTQVVPDAVGVGKDAFGNGHGVVGDDGMKYEYRENGSIDHK